MHRLLSGVAVLTAVFCLPSLALAAAPNLKPAVRLGIDVRSHGSAFPEVVDWDNDGLNDLVVGYFSGALSVYLNRGVGKNGIVFEKGEITRTDSFRNAGAPAWAWRFNKGTCVCPGPGRVSPRVVDWNNDGKKDLIIGDGRGAQTRVWSNIGSNSAPVFSTHHIQYLPPDGGIRPYHETVQPCIADWNGDERKDLIMGRNRGIYIYPNEGTDDAPDFNFRQSRLGMKLRDLFPSERLSPAFVDWDNDGLPDLIAGSQSGEVWFARNTGRRQQPAFDGYSRVQAAGQDIQTGSETHIAVADLDGDGIRDLVVGGSSGLVRFFQAKQSQPVARSRRVRLQKPGRLRRPDTCSTLIELFGTDDAGRALTYAVLSQPRHGRLTGTAPGLTYTVNRDFEGRDEFKFRVFAGDVASRTASVIISVEPPAAAPSITTHPADELAATGQPARFQVTVTGTKPFSFQWTRNGQRIPGATAPEYVIRQTDEDDSAEYAVTVTNAAGSVTSQPARLQVRPLPAPSDDLPVIDIEYQSPVAEPKTPGTLVLTRSGNTAQSVTVKLTTRRAHDPVIADLQFVPVQTSVTFKANQTSSEIRVVPIDDTLVTGLRTMTFQVVPNPAYRLARKTTTAQMMFLDDDCPRVGISLVKRADTSGPQTFRLTAEPAPRRDTTLEYSIGGTAVAGVDYEALPGRVTIPAGDTSADIVINPYRRRSQTSTNATPTTVVITLPVRRFTFFDFYNYLTEGRPRRAGITLAPSESTPMAPSQTESLTDIEPAVEKLRSEVGRLGWIVFTGRSGGPGSDLDIFKVRPDGSSLQNLTRTPEFDEFSARVSPDGQRMLYRRLKTTGRSWRADVTQQDVGTKALSTWLPAGTLVVANADGSNPRPVGDNGDFAWATWGPTGQQVACLEEVASEQTASRKPSYAIVVRDAGTLETVREFPSRGIHSHAAWSPDGKHICGVASVPPGKARYGKGVEYPLGIGSMVSLDVETGKRTSLSRFPDWYPVWAIDTDGDWFQGGSPCVLHSANNYGICPAYYSMLWRSGLQGEPSELVFGEYGRNVWGGCTSPDDRYAIFVIGGDKWPLQGRMAIIRLDDAPISRGPSPLFHEVLADHFPNVKRGPVLDLTSVPEGFDPHWVAAAR